MAKLRTTSTSREIIIEEKCEKSLSLQINGRATRLEVVNSKGLEETEKDDEQCAKEQKRKERILQVLNTHMLINTGVNLMVVGVRPVLLSSLLNENSKRAGSLSSLWAGAAGATEFLVNPILGRLSDRYGRKANLLIGPVTNVLLKSLVALYPSVTTIALERVLCGALTTVSGSTTCSAVISDVASGKDLAMNATTLGAYAGLGCVLGPLLGGEILSRTQNTRIPFAVAAIIAAIDFSMTLNLYEETLSKVIPLDLSAVNPLRVLRLFEGSTTMTTLIFTAGLLCFPEGKNLSDFNQLFILNHVNFTEKMRTIFTAGYGASMFVGGVVARKMLQILGQRRHTSASCWMSMAGLSLWALRPTPFNMFLGLIIMTFGMERRAAVTAMATKEALKIGIGKGEFAGLFANWRAIVTCVAPIIYGRVYARVHKTAPGAPYMLAGILVMVGELIHQCMPDGVANGHSNNTEKKCG